MVGFFLGGGPPLNLENAVCFKYSVGSVMGKAGTFQKALLSKRTKDGGVYCIVSSPKDKVKSQILVPMNVTLLELGFSQMYLS